MKLIVDFDPNNEEFYAIWTDKEKAVNATICEGIGDKTDAYIILSALKEKYKNV